MLADGGLGEAEALREIGAAGMRERCRRHIGFARHLADRAETPPRLELLLQPTLSICCFRYAPVALRGDDEALDRLNQRLLTAVMGDGRVYCSNAVLNGRFCLRACIVNFRTEAEDVDALLDVAAELGSALDVEMRAGARA